MSLLAPQVSRRAAAPNRARSSASGTQRGATRRRPGPQPTARCSASAGGALDPTRAAAVHLRFVIMRRLSRALNSNSQSSSGGTEMPRTGQNAQFETSEPADAPPQCACTGRKATLTSIRLVSPTDRSASERIAASSCSVPASAEAATRRSDRSGTLSHGRIEANQWSAACPTEADEWSGRWIERRRTGEVAVAREPTGYLATVRHGASGGRFEVYGRQTLE